MRQSVPHNSSRISAYVTGWKIRDYANTTSTNTVLCLPQNFPLPKNSTQWLDSLRPNELGARLRGSLTTARRRFWLEKASQNSKRIAAQLNIKLVDGSFPQTENLLLFEMERK